MQPSSLTYVLHNLHGQFSPFQFFIFLLKIFEEFAREDLKISCVMSVFTYFK